LSPAALSCPLRAIALGKGPTFDLTCPEDLERLRHFADFVIGRDRAGVDFDFASGQPVHGIANGRQAANEAMLNVEDSNPDCRKETDNGNA
jgi:hypothetical protein